MGLGLTQEITMAEETIATLVMKQPWFQAHLAQRDYDNEHKVVTRGEHTKLHKTM